MRGRAVRVPLMVLSILGALAGCDAEAADTGVIVVVGTDHRVPEELGWVTVQILNEEGRMVRSKDFDLAGGAAPGLPFSFTVLPRTGRQDGRAHVVLLGGGHGG